MKNAIFAPWPVVTSAAALVEAIHPRINDAALKWTPSRLRVESAAQAIAQSAATLLRTAGLHGHRYAIDATLCATALARDAAPFRRLFARPHTFPHEAVQLF
ncbi:hypothetical protein ACFU99_00360 [Streptomyces sp. NPDC057654]|uniref:hypothetical protein n=1 Tax=Streptomyces sp. NPDC057654 TaxID=3346196 RepID=UPI00368548CB